MSRAIARGEYKSVPLTTTPASPRKPDVVDSTEIARRLGVKRDTVLVWRQRQEMIEPDWFISGAPAWLWRRVKKWAEENGRGRISI